MRLSFFFCKQILYRFMIYFGLVFHCIVCIHYSPGLQNFLWIGQSVRWQSMEQYLTAWHFAQRLNEALDSLLVQLQRALVLCRIVLYGIKQHRIKGRGSICSDHQDIA